ncbi:MAG: AbrB/MazE/SpoVT family DNA-binding domain-containing protein [Sulfolobus sp.]|nr:AbrB/MazE/SpoVT family DNA-binding domain-containing protein [Sulfolobus sp.]
MEVVKVTRNYQITLPVAIREKLNISIGDRLVVYTDGKRIIIEKVNGDITKVKVRLNKQIDANYVEKIIREAGEELGSSSGH